LESSFRELLEVLAKIPSARDCSKRQTGRARFRVPDQRLSAKPRRPCQQRHLRFRGERDRARKDIELYSCANIISCRSSEAHVAYIPNGKVIGSQGRAGGGHVRPPANQENLTIQIADALMKKLHPTGVAVVIEAKHLCMMMRGVEKQNSVMKTSCLLGSFKEDGRTRSEFLALLA
jgi:GTP cyclohydrolase I